MKLTWINIRKCFISTKEHTKSTEVNLLSCLICGYRDSSPKNENSVIIYSPSRSSNPVWMCLFCWTQRKIFRRMWETEHFWGSIDFHSIFFPTMEVNGAPKQPGYKLSSKYLPLFTAEQRNLYRFGTTWGWVNNDRIFIFGLTIPLRLEGIQLRLLGMHIYIFSEPTI